MLLKGRKGGMKERGRRDKMKEEEVKKVKMRREERTNDLKTDMHYLS